MRRRWVATGYGGFKPGNMLHLSVDDFHDAPRKLVALLLRQDLDHIAKSFFFGGWLGKGVGASSILRATAQLLKSTSSDQFGKVLHVDCSLWKNRRDMQRAITKELNLGHLLSVIDKQNEDDDFRGINISSRVEIKSIGLEISASLRNKRFLMIFHYGGEEYIDLAEFGIPYFGPYALGKLLWTSHGRFQLSERKIVIKTNDAYFRVIDLYPTSYTNTGQLLRQSLHEEVVEVIGYIGMHDINPAIILECFLYSVILVEQLYKDYIIVDYGWDTHACNYWICDGILQGDRAREVGNALFEVIHMLSAQCSGIGRGELDGHRERNERWISVYLKEVGRKDISTLSINVSSYFLTFAGDGHLQLPKDLFGLANNLGVLKLYKCKFSFASPPFQCCHNLRFICLDNCTNIGEEQEGGSPCFPNLLVLDIRFTELVFLAEMMTNLRELNTRGVSWRTISQAWTKLLDLHKLRLTESFDLITVNTMDMMNLELLDLSGNIHMGSLPTISSAQNLKMLTLDGCSRLRQVALQGAAPHLESFSFDGYGPTEKWTHLIQLPKKELRPNSRSDLVQEAKVQRISLEGCDRLRNVYLRALHNLEELDLSNTAVKTLDLSAMDVPRLKKLFLLGCEQLCSLIWDKRSPRLEDLHVDTRGKIRSVIYDVKQRSSAFEAFMAFTDGRFVWSVMNPLNYASFGSLVHLHISSKIHSEVNISKSIKQIGPMQEGLVPACPFLPYIDIAINKDILTRSSLVWDQRKIYPLGVHIEIGEGSHHLESMRDIESFKHFTDDKVQSLHVHDNISITTIIPGASRVWSNLEWCHVERCRKLHTLFPGWARKDLSVSCSRFESLHIFSASDLPTAYCVWGRCDGNVSSSFRLLQHIYLHNCPRLVFVLPIGEFTMANLETIQIAYCHNLEHIFPRGNEEYTQEVVASGVTFGSLKHVKLYHLHKIEQICEDKLFAPALETISLRDCWALRRIPAVSCGSHKPVVDCEKDLWDRLEWDGFEKHHDPSLFETRHSAYYKNGLPRVSVLR